MNDSKHRPANFEAWRAGTDNRHTVRRALRQIFKDERATPAERLEALNRLEAMLQKERDARAKARLKPRRSRGGVVKKTGDLSNLIAKIEKQS